MYLYGLIEIANTIRTAFAAGRVDVVRLLFAGKLPVSALPALARCAQTGLVVRPAFAPPWATDPRGILALLTLSTFLTRIDLPSMVAAADALLADCPVVEFPRPEPAAIVAG